MAIQVRRGNEADFDANKMLPGEWAVSLDTRYVRMCFAPGLVLRMSTYESFEADMAQIQEILLECRTIQSAVQRIQAEVNAKASLTIEYSNSAKQSADRAYSEAERAKTYANNAEAVTGVQIATKDRAGLIKGGDNYIAEDGTLTLIVETTETTMPNSCEGRLLFKEIRGKTEQGANPSPTNPQEIKSVVISGIKTYRNNLFDYSKAVNGYITNDGEFSYHPYVIISDYIPSNGNVTVSLSKNVAAIAINCFNVNEGFISKNIFENCSVATLESVENCAYVRVAFTVDNSDVDITRLMTYEPMVNEGNIALPYEPISVVIFSKPIELNGIGDVQDVIVDGKPIRKFGVRIFNGSETWILATGQENSNTFHCEVPDAKRSKTTQNCLCDTYNFVDTDQRYLENNECTMYHDISDYYLGSNRIYIRDTTCTTNSEFKAKLQANPITVVYELEIHATEALPTADQVALNSIDTFDGTTYLKFDSPIQPEFVAEYGTSKVGGKTLEALATARNNDLRLSSLEASVVNNI